MNPNEVLDCQSFGVYNSLKVLIVIVTQSLVWFSYLVRILDLGPEFWCLLDDKEDGPIPSLTFPKEFVSSQRVSVGLGSVTEEVLEVSYLLMGS